MPLCPALLSRPRGLAGYLEQALLPARGGLHGPVAVWSPEYRNADGSYRDIIGGLAGVPSGVTYYNRVNVTGTLSPNVAADGWEVGGMYNGKPYYKHPTQDWYIWWRLDYQRWRLSGNPGLLGGSVWGSPVGEVGNTSLISRSFDALQSATGTATVTADTSSGVYLFVPSVTETAGPTINNQTARAWGFGGAGSIATAFAAPAGAFTFCAWIKINSGNGALFSLANTSSGPAFYLPYNTSQALLVLGGTNYRLFTGVSVSDGQWHMVAVACPGAAQSDIASARCWLDGTELTAGTTVQTGVQLVRSTVRIGQVGSAYLNGDLALASIHARALSADEIQYLYLAAKGV